MTHLSCDALLLVQLTEETHLGGLHDYHHLIIENGKFYGARPDHDLAGST